ncbi:hypothetical protein [Aurantiacibacter gangjinensis]|uniref:Uncharacterized protein n=1 Tax=Aurantiacibacter gangjinensis TaxID=502682 RepID=A0A0G9MQL6_9SPHN|nr:hypothetical protein [Aurantiacibacter gangjinensis]APE28898.1 hypothetical protein BMF35_a2069 [Aurantiacibacter gangjinensis]KLE33026.1 hypothetical protein AAW01_03230 [Aurantiacibacter gangjinensis]
MLTSIAFAIALQATQPAQDAPASPSPTPPCESDGHGGFDFWVGEWSVTPNGAEEPVANSSIQRLHGGCAVREQWMPFRGEGGSSLNHYDARTGIWRQVWIGSAGERVEFTGGRAGEAMVLAGYWGRGPQGNPLLVRMTYTPDADDYVRQHGETSTDHGLTWQTSFDYIYRPLPAADAE